MASTATGASVSLFNKDHVVISARADEKITVTYGRTLSYYHENVSSFSIQRSFQVSPPTCYTNGHQYQIHWIYFLDNTKSLIYVDVSKGDHHDYFVYNNLEYTLEELDNTSYNDALFTCTGTGKKAPSTTPIAHKPNKLKSAQDLSVLRLLSSECDFAIMCKDVSIPVHSLVLKAYWPYFKTMMDTECVERKDMNLKLELPEEWVRKLVSYLYGEPFETSFDEITGLMTVGELYQLPELVEMATKEILTYGQQLDLKQLAVGWKRASESNNSTVKQHLFKYMSPKLKGSSLEEVAELKDFFTTDQVWDLFVSAIGCK